MADARDQILDAAERLVIAGRIPPPLQAVADEAGVSKGGVLYHFTTRTLLHGLVQRAVRMADTRLRAAAEAGVMASTWLRMSAPDEPERRLFQAMLSMLRVTSGGVLDLPAEVREAEVRWDAMLEAELGDPARARVVRLIGDGLFFAALTGQAPTTGEVDELVRHLGLPAAR
ncbi:TetR family transcriptional regulator [Saccharothrix carnea]|uniref:TetR family transcriptional regulator n=1 Tax=Saccharothrix carnea TaxID=1280637 RepID=A0A2P8IF05_SACCR|nr:TetR/AcrR family transcriptional regulator [Saccharothrix carnea]PSL57059.1 TetR family transcriptional regulator [Saccharothrix carnea]